MMKYIKLPEAYPIKDVDVHVVTASGKKGVARYWPDLDKWLTEDKNLEVTDTVVKWKYADAVLDVKPGETYSNTNKEY